MASNDEITELDSREKCIEGLQEVSIPVKLDVSDTWEEVISDEELMLARKIRGCCHPWGVEMDHRLSDSATLLLEMGKLYLEKARNSNGMLQKISFIKCAALIAGARVRFEKHLADEGKELEATELYRRMVEELLKASKAKCQNDDLLQTSQFVSNTLKLIRKNEREQLQEKMKLVDYDSLSETEVVEKQREKIAFVRGLSERETFVYTYLMNLISKKCVSTMGEIPCKMSLVGLGSLARKEVTLYSDFEHVILLEEEIDDSPSGNIREYFRWYSVLFQIIVIGIGETCIPSVGVKSLNDLYNSDGTKNWFYDIFTPSGVSFDGRLPHACKIPLGKQEPTKKKKHVVELIQPISKMVRFLSADEDLKNGYHLRDVLLRTCLVDGDKGIYLKFKEAVLRRVITSRKDEQVMEQAKFVSQNVNDFIGEKNFKLYSEKVKDIFYRPITVLVSCIARILNFDGSNFEFFSWLKEHETGFDTHSLEYALTVAWEIRAKLYSTSGRQQAKSLPKDICDSVGKKCVISCFKTIKILSKVFHDAWNKRQGLIDFLSSLIECTSKDMDVAHSALGSMILQRFGFVDDILPNFDYQKVEKYFTGRNKAGLANLQLAYLHFNSGRASNEKMHEHYPKVHDILREIPEDLHLTHEYVLMMSEIHEYRGNHGESYRLLTKWLLHSRENAAEIGLSDSEDYRMRLQRAVACSKSIADEDFIEQVTTELAENPDPLNQIAFNIPLSATFLKLKRITQAKECLKKVIDICKNEGVEISSRLKLAIANKVFHIQQVECWADDSLETAKYIESNQNVQLAKPLAEDLQQIQGKEHLNSDSIEMCIAAVRLLKCKEDFSFETIMSISVELGQLLSEVGVENFPIVQHHFDGVSPKVFETPIFHIDLSITLSDYQQKFSNLSYYEIGQTLKPFLRKFEQSFLHPYQLNPIKSLTASVVVKSFELKRKMVENKIKTSLIMRANKTDERLYKQALQNLTALKVEDSAKFFWKILQRCPARALLRKSCNFLFHIITVSPFVSLMQHIHNHRIIMKRRLSYKRPTKLQEIFNNAAGNYVEHRHPQSANALWKITFLLTSNQRAKYGRLINRSVELLMFVVLTVLENSGYVLGATDTHFSVAGTNPSPCTNIVDTYAGLFPDPIGTTNTFS